MYREFWDKKLVALKNAGPSALAFVVAILCLSTTRPAAGETIRSGNTTVDIVPVTTVAAAGDTIPIIFTFTMRPGWHIYWKNPGDSGMAPSIRWTLPAGMAHGDLLFPTPHRISAPPFMTYGYPDKVTLLTELYVHDSMPQRNAIAKVDWLECEDICVPGSGSVRFVIREGKTNLEPAILDRVERARAGIPGDAPLPIGLKVYRDHVTLHIPGTTQGAYFFPEERWMEYAAPQEFAPSSTGGTLRLKRDMNVIRLPEIVRGVLVLDDGAAFAVTVGNESIFTIARGIIVLGLMLLGGLILILIRKVRRPA